MDTGRGIAVIGAGLAGLTAARVLADAGRHVTIFEKSRGRGGRMATRRAEGRHFDHGAQFFTARSPEFKTEVARWTASSAAAAWHGRVVGLPGGAPDVDERFVGVPGMSGIGRFLAEGHDVRLRVRVSEVRRDAEGWHVRSTDGDHAGPFETVIVATPAEQAAPLLAAAPVLAAHAAAAQMRPCWAVLVGLDAALDLPFDAARITSGTLSWIARDTSKPGRPNDGAAESWVLHASADWSEQHIDSDPSEVTARLTDAFARVTGAELPQPAFTAAHLWRYALTATPLGETCMWDDGLRIGVCGDWCLGNRVEAAFESGRAMAARVLE